MPVSASGSQLEPVQGSRPIEVSEDEQSEASRAKRRREQNRLALQRATRSTRHTVSAGAGRSANRLPFQKIEGVVRQEPLIRRAIQKWSGAMVREWFKIVDPKTGVQHNQDPAFQVWARRIGLKPKTKSALVSSRVFGDGLFEYEWADRGDPDSGRIAGSPLVDVHTVDPVTAQLREIDLGEGHSGVQLIQKIGQDRVVLHPDRVRHIVVDRLEGYLRGLSAVEVAFHVAISKVQGDQSSGEILFHAGVPIRHIQITDGDDDDIQFYTEMLKDPKFTRGFATDESVDMEQYNPIVVDPKPFYDHFLESIAAAVGLPEMMVRGAQAGQVSGSETNLEDWRQDITEVRENVLDPVMEEIVAGATGLDQDSFDIKWNPFPRNKESEAKTWRELSNAASNLINLCGLTPKAAFRILGIEDVKDNDFQRVPEGHIPPVGRAED